MNNNLKNLIRSALFLAIAIIFQAIGKALPQSQFITGPVVNAVLIIACAVCGIMWGVLVGALTPLLAWVIGQLPTPFGPFIPFIMIGNALFVIGFGLIARRKNKRFKIGILPIAGVIVGAVIKFLFLKVSSSKFIDLFNLGIPKKIAANLAVMMSTPQLITALAGGAIALVLLTILAKRKQI